MRLMFLLAIVALPLSIAYFAATMGGSPWLGALLTLPLTLITLGLFTLVINAIVFWVATLFPIGVKAQDFGGAFLGALTVSAVSFVASRSLE